jgi:signal transduction histidine kinase
VLANAEVKRMNENLEGIVFERTKELEEAHQELDTFLYRASHDLRSPVCSIIGLCNIALHLSNGESKELVQKVANTTTGMDKLLKKLSIISEINQPSNFSSITLKNVVESMRYKYITTIKEHHINLVIDCPAHLTINSYPDLIEVILTNLLENALFYSVMKHPDHAQVEIRASIKNDQLEISVYDNGIGIEDNIRHRLYDMFFKGNVNSKGNGLGLYIVHKSVQALDGTISLESKAGQFTKFLVRLPLKPMEEARLIPVATAEFSEV